MENTRFGTVSGTARLLAAALGLLAATSAWAGTDSASFKVGLRIAASCQVDSSPVIDAAAPAAIAAPAVDCGLSTPRSVLMSREAEVLSQAASPSSEAGTALVVTLTF